MNLRNPAGNKNKPTYHFKPNSHFDKEDQKE
jgi:hypothetical protein